MKEESLLLLSDLQKLINQVVLIDYTIIILGGEIDFVAQTLKTHIRYLIEVKAGKGTASTALKALEQGKANKLLYLKGDTKGGTVGNVQTLPIYLLEQYHF
ncbi:hypothetical protein [Agathobacter rectalis]|uniref:hypothetical protein n=1 Tax=Agathobacter rectalis TaxID=39491 RepID=UPI003D645924